MTGLAEKSNRNVADSRCTRVRTFLPRRPRGLTIGNIHSARGRVVSVSQQKMIRQTEARNGKKGDSLDGASGGGYPWFGAKHNACASLSWQKRCSWRLHTTIGPGGRRRRRSEWIQQTTANKDVDPRSENPVAGPGRPGPSSHATRFLHLYR